MIDAESRSEVRSDLKDLKPTVLLVGAVLYAAALIVVFFLVMPSSSSPSHLCCGETVGDPSITVHEKEWSISAPKVWSMGYHEVNVVNVGKVPHELVMFKTDLTAVQLLSNPGTSIRERALCWDAERGLARPGQRARQREQHSSWDFESGAVGATHARALRAHVRPAWSLRQRNVRGHHGGAMRVDRRAHGRPSCAAGRIARTSPRRRIDGVTTCCETAVSSDAGDASTAPARFDGEV